MIENNKMIEVFTDNVSLEHRTPKIIDTTQAIIIPIFTIKNKRGDRMWVTPINSSFPWTSKWNIYAKKIKIQCLNIHKLSKEADYVKEISPPCEQKWAQVLQSEINWKHLWNIIQVFCTPKDTLTWLKLKHRNLKVAKTDDESHTNC